MACGLLVVLLMSSSTVSAKPPAELLSAVAARFQSLRSFELSGRMVGAAVDGSVRMEAGASVATARGDMVPAESGVPAIPEAQWFRRWSAVDSRGHGYSGSFGTPSRFGNYGAVAAGIASVRELSVEPLEADGRRVECRVIEVVYGAVLPGRAQVGTVRFWIDPLRELVLREAFEEYNATARVKIAWTFSVTSISLNAAPPDWLIGFAKALIGRPVDGWVGRAAPDFSGDALDGESLSLSALRGKVVVLNFWGTWCGPCREEMPELEKLGATYSARDVVVLGISSDPPDVARRWLQMQGRSLRTVTDQDGKLFALYDVDAIPVVVVINRAGKVVKYFSGLQPRGVVASAVAEGLKD